jgi:hypothetical protein
MKLFQTIPIIITTNFILQFIFYFSVCLCSKRLLHRNPIFINFLFTQDVHTWPDPIYYWYINSSWPINSRILSIRPKFPTWFQGYSIKVIVNFILIFTCLKSELPSEHWLLPLFTVCLLQTADVHSDAAGCRAALTEGTNSLLRLRFQILWGKKVVEKEEISTVSAREPRCGKWLCTNTNLRKNH